MADESAGKISVDIIGNSRPLQNTINNLSSIVQKPLAKLGGVIAAAFSAAAVIKFGKDSTEAAASVNAANSQMAQTFGNLESTARAAMQNVAKDSGIIETRLQGVGTSIYAFAKSSGMDSASAMSMMQDALQVTADSAAYYDRSLEETAESLKSFLKGNYANDAALGISCTETTRNIAANKLYGKSFKDLSEAQKQLALLQMVKDANKLSGALGQAAREADGWENVTGNLKESWRQLLAVVGQPVLKAATTAVKNLTSALQTLTVYAKTAVQSVAKLLNLDMSDISSAGNAAAESIGNVAGNADDSADNLGAATKAAEKLKKTVAGFDQLNILSSDDSDSDSDSADSQSSTGSTAAIIPEPDTSKAESAIDRIGIKLGSLRDKLREIYDTSPLNDFVGSFNEQFNKIDFSGIVNNFQGIMQNLKPIVQSYLNGTGKILTSKMKLFGTIIGSIIRTVTNILQTITGGINQFLGENKGRISSFITTITGNVSDGIDNINRLISTISNVLNDSLERMRGQTQDAIATMLGGFTTFSGTVGTITSEAFSIATKTIADWAADNEDKIGEFFDNVQGIFNHTMTTIGEVFDDAGKTIDNIWNNGGRQMWEGICQIVTDLGDIFIDTFNNHITPIVNGFVDLLKSAWTDMLQPFFDSVGNALTKLFNEIIKPLWDNILKPLFAWIVDKIFTQLKQQFERVKGFFQGIFEAVGSYLKGLWDSFSGFIDFIKGIFTGNWEQAWNGIKGIFNGISNSIKGIVNGIKNAFLSVWKSIEDHWKRAGDFFGNVWTAISGAFKGAKDWLIEQFTKAWDGIKSLFTKGGEFFEGIAESIGEVFTNTVNSLIDGINWVIAQPFNALNDALGGIKNVGIGGIKPFDWIETIPVPQIPKLAAGGLVTAPTLAMVGDNKGASHDPEVVAPLSKLQGMIGSSDPEIIGLLSKIIGLLENEESVYQNVIYLDSEAIERKLVKVRKRKQRRYGGAST